MKKSPWKWVPSGYFIQGFSNIFIVDVLLIFFKNMGLKNSLITALVSLLSLPWMLKFLWSPYLECCNRRRCLLILQFSGVALLCLLALSMAFSFIAVSIFALLFAFMGAIYDTLLDGHYLHVLSVDQQARFVWPRSLAYQFSRWSLAGLFIILIGLLMHYFSMLFAWMIGVVGLAFVLALLSFYHYLVLPPQEIEAGKKEKRESAKIVWKGLFALPSFGLVGIFLLLFNLPFSQFLRIYPLYLLGDKVSGGLGFHDVAVGWVWGVLGISFMMLGVFMSSRLHHRARLFKCMWFSYLGFVLVNVLLLVLPVSLAASCFLSASFMFLFGLGSTAYMLYLIRYFGQHRFKMSFYAVGTLLMGVSLMLPGLWVGYIQGLLGYLGFFLFNGLLAIALLFVFYPCSRKLERACENS